MVRARLLNVLPWVTSVRPVLTIVDPMAVVLAGLVAFAEIPVVALAAAALTVAAVGRGTGLHRSRLTLSVLEDLPALVLAAGTAVVALVVASPTINPARLQVWDDVALFGALMFAAMVLLRTATYATIHLLRLVGLVTHSLLVVGAGPTGQQLTAALLDHPEHGLRPVGMLACGGESSVRGLPVPLVGGLADLDLALRDLAVHDVVFACPEPPGPEVAAAVRRCLQQDLQVFVVPQSMDSWGTEHRRTEMVLDVAVLRLRRRPRPATRLVRRGVDIVAALGGLVVLAPLLALVAVLVRLETGPGVIYQQTRVTDAGNTFTLLKFTTLQPARFGAEATTWSIDNESRIGPAGRVLRRTGLDDLPQLVNVLRGELSLLSPRLDQPVAGLESFHRSARGSARRPLAGQRHLTALGGSRPDAGTRAPDHEPSGPRRG
ncbi:MAG: sugar transferase [Nocardioides sp.]|nr:sugar transferase [Nocardioides sp.]